MRTFIIVAVQVSERSDRRRRFVVSAIVVVVAILREAIVLSRIIERRCLRCMHHGVVDEGGSHPDASVFVSRWSSQREKPHQEDPSDGFG